MIGGMDYRDPITQSLLARRAAQQRQQQQQQPQSPFRPPLPRPVVMGTPPPRPAEPASPYGFQSGFNAAMGTPRPEAAGRQQGWSDLYARLFGKEDDWSAGGGSAAP